MFVFNFRCTNSSGPRHSEVFEHVPQTVTLSREDDEAPRSGVIDHKVARMIFSVYGRSFSSFGMTIQAYGWYFANCESTFDERFHF
jgi:hypothetical protein